MSHRHRGRKLMTVVGARLAVSRRERTRPVQRNTAGHVSHERSTDRAEEGKNRRAVAGGKKKKRKREKKREGGRR